MANEVSIYEPRHLIEVVRTPRRSARFCGIAFSPT